MAREGISHDSHVWAIIPQSPSYQCVEVDLDNKVYELCLFGSNDVHAISYLTLQSKMADKRHLGIPVLNIGAILVQYFRTV